jgi:hypothetical protein
MAMAGAATRPRNSHSGLCYTFSEGLAEAWFEYTVLRIMLTVF